MSLPTKRLFSQDRQEGFTLLELLVVVAILGILASIAFALLNPAALFGQSRDTRRKSDLKQIKTSLQLYYNDNKSYPNNDTWITNATAWFGIGGGGPDLVPSYIKSMPGDPDSTKTYDYRDSSTTGGCTDNQSFALRARLDITTDPQAYQNGVSSTYVYWCNGTTSIGTVVGDNGYYYLTSD